MSITQGIDTAPGLDADSRLLTEKEVGELLHKARHFSFIAFSFDLLEIEKDDFLLAMLEQAILPEQGLWAHET